MSIVLMDQKLWDLGYEGQELLEAEPSDPLRAWLELTLGRGDGKCLELGCFPGRYLSVLGGLGYELNGIDLTPRVAVDMAPWLSGRGYRVGRFICEDVWASSFNREYDVVCSFGLIEHFVNWRELICRQAEWVAPGGYLVVCTPNFRGVVQRSFHSFLDRKNFMQHNLDAMQPLLWSELVKPLGFTIVQSGYLGSLRFWFGEERRSVLQRVLIRAICASVRFLDWLPDGKESYSPYCVLIARRDN